MAELTEQVIKEKIASYTARLDSLKAEIVALRAQLEEKENIGKQIVGGLKTLQELVKEVQ